MIPLFFAFTISLVFGFIMMWFLSEDIFNN